MSVRVFDGDMVPSNMALLGRREGVAKEEGGGSGEGNAWPGRGSGRGGRAVLYMGVRIALVSCPFSTTPPPPPQKKTSNNIKLTPRVARLQYHCREVYDLSLPLLPVLSG